MEFRYTVTFEQPETQPPYSVSGTVQAGRAPAAVRRAVDEAMTQAPGRRWSSMVVLLERGVAATEVDVTNDAEMVPSVGV